MCSVRLCSYLVFACATSGLDGGVRMLVNLARLFAESKLAFCVYLGAIVSCFNCCDLILF